MPYYSQDMIGGAMNSTHIYYNINISNDYSGYGEVIDNVPQPVESNGKNYQIVFNQTRQQPYIIKPNDYYLSVLRFTIATPNLPILLCQPIVGQSNVNKSIYAITLVMIDDLMNETVETQNLIWEPDDKSVPIPTGIVTDKWQIDPYYQCHSYNHFVDLINNTFKSFLPFLDTFTDNYYPYMYFDSDKNLFTVGAASAYYRTSLDGTEYLGSSNYKVKIYFNIELYNLFSSLKASYIGTSAESPAIGADYQLIMDTGTNVPYNDTQPFIENIYVNPEIYNDYSPSAATNDVINTQEYSTIAIWNPVVNIVFRTSLLTVVPDIVGTPVVYENGFNNINQGKSNSDILNIMTDYTVPPSIGLKPYIIYEPVGEYRLVELYGNQPINSMDIAVFWKDRFGNLQPFYLAIGASATIKILFRKKIFN